MLIFVMYSLAPHFTWNIRSETSEIEILSDWGSFGILSSLKLHPI